MKRLVLAVATALVAATGAVSATAAPTLPVVAQGTWVEHRAPVVSRKSDSDNIASDPSVIADRGGYRMVYTGPSRQHTRSSLIEATSPDGLHWKDVGYDDGVVLQGTPGNWDAYIETSMLMKVNGTYLLFYSGYPTDDTGTNATTHGQLGLATSRDGVHFTRVSAAPVMPTTPGGLDEEAIFSPTIVDVHGVLWMLYTGWKGDGGQLLGARSYDLGRHWTKVTTGPVFGPSNTYAYMDNSTDEAELVASPKGGFDLFFTAGSLEDEPMDSIGVAHSATTPFGPWTLTPRPVVTEHPTELWQSLDIGFPTVIDEQGRQKMWFTGLGVDLTTGISPLPAPVFKIGYAFSPGSA